MEAVNNVDIIRYYIVQYDADEICPAISGRIVKTEMIFLLYLWPSCPPIFCFLIEGSARKVPFFFILWRLCRSTPKSVFDWHKLSRLVCVYNAGCLLCSHWGLVYGPIDKPLDDAHDTQRAVRACMALQTKTITTLLCPLLPTAPSRASPAASSSSAHNPAAIFRGVHSLALPSLLYLRGIFI